MTVPCPNFLRIVICHYVLCHVVLMFVLLKLEQHHFVKSNISDPIFVMVLYF